MVSEVSYVRFSVKNILPKILFFFYIIIIDETELLGRNKYNKIQLFVYWKLVTWMMWLFRGS